MAEAGASGGCRFHRTPCEGSAAARDGSSLRIVEGCGATEDGVAYRLRFAAVAGAVAAADGAAAPTSSVVSDGTASAAAVSGAAAGILRFLTAMGGALSATLGSSLTGAGDGFVGGGLITAFLSALGGAATMLSSSVMIRFEKKEDRPPAHVTTHSCGAGHMAPIRDGQRCEEQEEQRPLSTAM